jgi:uracil-DNA glycosylase family 4
MSLISNIYVPDEEAPDAKIVAVGETPGVDEESNLRPFYPDAPAGGKLTSVLGRNGLQRGVDVALRNLCHYRPAGNKFNIVIGTPQLKSGLEELVAKLKMKRPNVVAAMGNWPLWFLTGKRGIQKWRGSILECNIPGLEGLKVIPTFHPSYIARDASNYPIFDIDWKRIKDDSSFPELRLPVRKFIIDPRGDELEYWVSYLLDKPEYSFDIENVSKTFHILCIGFSPSPDLAVVIPNHNDVPTRDAWHRLLTVSPARKIPHYGIHDVAVLHHNDIEVTNYVWDTMVAQHVMWPELPRTLAYLTSVYTREPFYKDEGKVGDDSDQKSWSLKFDKSRLYNYNAKDAAVTIEIKQGQLKEMEDGPDGWAIFFAYEMEMLEPAAVMSRTGLLIDQERRKTLEISLNLKLKDLQTRLNKLVGYVTNVKSPKIIQLLYEDLKLPPRRKKGQRDEEGEYVSKLTADEDAIISLISFTKDQFENKVKTESAILQWRRKHVICRLIIDIRGLRQLKSNYICDTKKNRKCGDDGRLRSTFKVPATDTGRWSAEHYVDGSGCAAQTFPRGKIEVPDNIEEAAMSLVAEDEDE